MKHCLNLMKKAEFILTRVDFALDTSLCKPPQLVCLLLYVFLRDKSRCSMGSGDSVHRSKSLLDPLLAVNVGQVTYLFCASFFLIWVMGILTVLTLLLLGWNNTCKGFEQCLRLFNITEFLPSPGNRVFCGSDFSFLKTRICVTHLKETKV